MKIQILKNDYYDAAVEMETNYKQYCPACNKKIKHKRNMLNHLLTNKHIVNEIEYNRLACR